MPSYEISYISNLSNEQQDKLAGAITTIHSEKFKTPRLFVNVSFKPEIANAYIAGNRKKSNSIRAWVRTGPSRTKQDYDDLAEQVAKAWKDTVGTQGTEKLGAIFVLGDVLAAHESGLLVPRAGEEPEWVKQNYAEFQELAKDEQTFRDLIEELQTRECFKGLVPPTH